MRRISVIARTAMLLSSLSTPGQVFAAPGDIVFSDNFERATLAPWTTTNAGASGISTGPQVSNSPNRGAFTSNTSVTLTSPGFSTAVPSAEITIWVRHGSDTFSEYPDNGENLVLEYRRADNSWVVLSTYLGGGTAGQVFTDTFALPTDALHGSFAVRLRQTSGSGFDWDYWHFDDVIVTEIAPPAPFGVGGCDDFESGLIGNWTINALGGFAGTSSATSFSPTSSMYTNGGVVEVTSTSIDTTDPAFSTLSMWVRRGSDAFSEDPDGGENLVVEYLDDVGAWVALESFSGAGGPGQIFNRSYAMPVAARHNGFQIRFRQTGGSGAPWDFWHVDDVCLDTQLLPDLLVTKVRQILSDPINGITNPYSIPGAIIEYTLTVLNEGPGAVDSGSLFITDVIPADSALYVDTGSGDPIVFVDGSVPSGLSYNFATSVSYSNQAGGIAPYNYTPVPDAAGYDAAVTAIQVTFTGIMSAAGGGNTPGFDLLLRLRIQ